MTRYLLDTNIISDLVKPAPSPRLLAWMAEQADTDLFVASLTIAEIWRGILESVPGRKRRTLEAWFDGAEGPKSIFSGRILPFDEAAGLVWGRLMAQGKSTGRPRSPLDMIIAAVAEVNGCTVVTANEKDFAGIDIVNPMLA